MNHRRIEGSESYELIVTGKKLLYKIRLEFSQQTLLMGESKSESKHLAIRHRTTNHQLKGKRARGFSAGLIVDECTSLVGGFDGSLLLVDKRKGPLTQVNKIHLDAVHHLQRQFKSTRDSFEGSA